MKKLLMLAAVVLLIGAWAQDSGRAIATGGLDGPFAYVANRSSGNVSVIDLSTETEVTTIATGGSPYWAAISADGSVVAVSLKDGTGVALIDGTTNTLLGVVGGVGGEPEAVAVNSDGSTAYVADESGEDLYVVDVASQTVAGSLIGLAGDVSPIDISSECSEPENMVISPDDAFLYITCATGTGEVIRVATAGFAITTIDDTGLDDPHGIALNPAGTRLYYTDGTDVFEWDTGSQSLTGTTFDDCEMYGGRVSPDGSQLLCQEENGSLRVYDTSDGSPFEPVTTSGTAVDAHPNGTRAYVPHSDHVEVVDLAEVKAAGGPLPGSIATSGSGGRGIAIGPAQPSAAGFKCYSAFGFPSVRKWVFLADQFGEKDAWVDRPVALCNPIAKDSNNVADAAGSFVEEDTLVCFRLRQEGPEPGLVFVENQFGGQELDVGRAERLCVRSEKSNGLTHGSAAGAGIVPNFKCYKARQAQGAPRIWPNTVLVGDQYDEKTSLVLWPVSLCVPVRKGFDEDGVGGAAGRGESELVLVCYRVFQALSGLRFEIVQNQFGTQLMLLFRAESLCVPSAKFTEP